jgi:hypothetical protein
MIITPEPSCSICTIHIGTLQMYNPEKDPNAEYVIYVCEGNCRDSLEEQGMVVDKVRIPGDTGTNPWWCSTARWG